MPSTRKEVIAAGLASLWLTAVLAPAAAAASLSKETNARVAFSLAARPSRPDLRAVPLGLSRPWLLAGGRGTARLALAADAVSRPRAKKLRAWIEFGVFATAVTANYWMSNSFPEDRDFGLGLDSQVPRIFFFEGWRFDSNQFSLNWGHFPGGALYYEFGRANHLSWLYAWMMSVAGSTWWEVIGEPKEVISINDQFMTGLGGYASGEPWYQIGNFLCHQPSIILRGLSFLNPILKFNRWLERRDPAAKEYIQPGWHELNVFAGGRRLTSAGGEAETDAYFGFKARLLGLPEYGLPGEVRRAVNDTYFSELTLDYATRGGHAEETRFTTKAVTWGHLLQKIGDNHEGYCLVLGLGSAFELFKKRPLADYDATPVPVKTDLERLHLEEPRNFTDKLAILHLAGPVLDWTVFRRDLRLRTVVEAYFDFALVGSNAINDYSRIHDIVGLKTTVFYYGYYYGFGGTFAASTRLDYKNFRVRGLATFSGWGSADFLDRFQAEVTNNAHLSDTRARYLLGVGWKLPGAPLEVFADVEGVRRWGRLAEVRAHRRETKTYAGLAFGF